MIAFGMMGFLRHRRSIKSISATRYEIAEGAIVSNRALPHPLDESRLAIPWQVAPQQSLPLLHQLPELSTIHTVGSIDLTNRKTFRLDFYMRQRIIVRLDFYVRQWALGACPCLFGLLLSVQNEQRVFDPLVQLGPNRANWPRHSGRPFLFRLFC
jgi:hypothetical protein